MADPTHTKATCTDSYMNFLRCHSLSSDSSRRFSAFIWSPIRRECSVKQFISLKLYCAKTLHRKHNFSAYIRHSNVQPSFAPAFKATTTFPSESSHNRFRGRDHSSEIEFMRAALRSAEIDTHTHTHTAFKCCKVQLHAHVQFGQFDISRSRPFVLKLNCEV